jgi:hypothetical protein
MGNSAIPSVKPQSSSSPPPTSHAAETTKNDKHQHIANASALDASSAHRSSWDTKTGPNANRTGGAPAMNPQQMGMSDIIAGTLLGSEVGTGLSSLAGALGGPNAKSSIDKTIKQANDFIKGNPTVQSLSRIVTGVNMTGDGSGSNSPTHQSMPGPPADKAQWGVGPDDGRIHQIRSPNTQDAPATTPFGPSYVKGINETMKTVQNDLKDPRYKNADLLSIDTSRILDQPGIQALINAMKGTGKKGSFIVSNLNNPDIQNALKGFEESSDKAMETFANRSPTQTPQAAQEAKSDTRGNLGAGTRSAQVHKDDFAKVTAFNLVQPPGSTRVYYNGNLNILKSDTVNVDGQPIKYTLYDTGGNKLSVTKDGLVLDENGNGAPSFTVDPKTLGIMNDQVVHGSNTGDPGEDASNRLSFVRYHYKPGESFH